MSLRSLREGVVANALSWIMITLGGMIVAYLKVHWPQVSGPLLYFLVGSTCIAILCYVASGHSLLKGKTTLRNVELKLRNWSHGLGFGVKRVEFPDSHFGLTITVANGVTLGVFVATKRPDYLQFRYQFVLSPETQSALNGLDAQHSERVTLSVALELSRAKVIFTIADARAAASQIPRLETILLDKLFPISDLTESAFIACVNEMNSSVSLVQSATALALSRSD